MRNARLISYVLFVLGVGIRAESSALPLRQALEEALQTHPSIANQVALKEVAQIDLRTALQQYFPTPSINVEQVNGGGSTDSLYGHRTTVYTYRLQQPLYTWGRLSAGVDKARAYAEAALEEVNDSRQQVSLRVIQAWADWRQNWLRCQALQKSVNTHQRLLDSLERRINSGASASSESSLTKSRLNQVAAQLQGYQGQLRMAKSRLSLLIGRTISEEEIPDVSEIDNDFIAQDLQGKAIQASAALRKIEAQRRALSEEAREKKAEWLPELFVRMERQEYRGDGSATLGQNNRLYFGFSSRFGAGLSNLTAMESIEKRQESKGFEYELARRVLAEVVQMDAEQIISLQSKMPLLQSALESARQTLESWDRQFLAGRRSWVDVMNAAREETQAEIDAQDAQVAYESAQWRLLIYTSGFDEKRLSVARGAN